MNHVDFRAKKESFYNSVDLGYIYFLCEEDAKVFLGTLMDFCSFLSAAFILN